MNTETLISNITNKKATITKNNSSISTKQSKINSNNKSIMDYKKKITTCKNMNTIKNYYTRIASLEKNNEGLNKEIHSLQNKNLTLQKDVGRYEKQLYSANNRNESYVEPLSVMVDVDENYKEEKISYNDLITNFCKTIKKTGLDTKYGLVKDIKSTSNQGGNGRILFGILNNKEVAIKVLYNSSKDKDNRFRNEFVNVFMALQKEPNVVEMYLYDTYYIHDQEVNYIIMKKYQSNLEKIEKNIDFNNLVKLIYELLDIMNVIHYKGIIHRDIKPANILIDENDKLILTDFGIANFDPDIYENTGHTVAQQYLGNRKFSAPEQSEPDAVPSPTMDIYAFGQIIQWYVTGKTHTGNGRIKLNTKIDDNRINVIDEIVDKCIQFEPKKRYQSVKEIYDFLETNGLNREKVEDKNNSKDFPIIESNDELYEGLDYGEEITVI